MCTFYTRRCLHNKDFLYFGEYCHLQMDKLWFLIGVSIGGFVVVLLIVVLSVCLVVSRRNKKTQEKEGGTRYNVILYFDNFVVMSRVYSTCRKLQVQCPL